MSRTAAGWILSLIWAVCARGAEIAGRIQYDASTPIDQAHVTLVSQDNGVRRATDSNRDGYYRIGGAQPGLYKLIVSKTGFKSAVRADIQLEVDQFARLDIALRLGPVEESITVEEQLYPLVTEDASVGTTIGKDLMEALPLNGRGLLTLMEAAPGVVITPASSSTDSGQFSVSGQRADANYVTIDGVAMNGGIAAPLAVASTLRQGVGGALPPFSAIGSMQGLVSTEALEEFRLQTAPARADSGRMPGGQLVLSTRSGTNKWHAAAFEHVRNAALDANDWFANASGLPRPPLAFHDFGGTFSGPIVHNRTFFFFSNENVRLLQSPVGTWQVPTAAARLAASPAMQPFVDSLPLPTQRWPGYLPGFAENAGLCTIAGRDSSRVNSNSIRIDHAVTSKIQIFGRYNHAPSADAQTLAGGAVQNALDLSLDTVTAGVDASPTSRLHLSARFGYLITAESVRLHGWGKPGQIYPGFAAVANTPFNDTAYSVGTLPEGINVPFENQSYRYRQRQKNVTGSAGYSAGTHALRVGVDLRTVSPNLRTLPFLAAVTPAVYLPTLDANLNAFLGGEFSAMQIIPSTPASFGLHNLSLFVQDDWKLTGKLTVSTGLRYESNPPPVANGREALFAAVPAGGGAQDAQAAYDGHELWKHGYNHAAPRLSVAYQPSASRGVVLRAAAGVYYDLGFGSALAGSYVSGPPTDIISLPGLPGPPQYITNTRPAAPPTYMLATDFRTPVTIRWNATVAQAVGKRGQLSVSYIGAAGEDLIKGEYFGSAQQVQTNRGFSRYHGLQAQLSGRTGSGLQGLVSFSWSHSIDNVSNDAIPASGMVIPNAPPNSDRGNSDFDIRLSAFAAVVYEIPHLRGWVANGVLRARSGFPFSVVAGWPQQRASLVPGQMAWIEDPGVPGGRRLNPAAFAIPAASVQGSTGRNAFDGPGMWQIDLALERQIRLSEQLSVQLRVDGFNLMNHPVFGNPDNLLTSATFGRPTSMLNQYLGAGGPASGLTPALQVGGPRALQVGVRLRF